MIVGVLNLPAEMTTGKAPATAAAKKESSSTAKKEDSTTTFNQLKTALLNLGTSDNDLLTKIDSYLSGEKVSSGDLLKLETLIGMRSSRISFKSNLVAKIFQAAEEIISNMKRI